MTKDVIMPPAANNINTSNVLILVPSALFASVEVEGGVRGGGGTEGGGDGEEEHSSSAPGLHVTI